MAKALKLALLMLNTFFTIAVGVASLFALAQTGIRRLTRG